MCDDKFVVYNGEFEELTDTVTFGDKEDAIDEAKIQLDSSFNRDDTVMTVFKLVPVADVERRMDTIVHDLEEDC